MEAAQARLHLHMSKCHIVGSHMSRLINNEWGVKGGTAIPFYSIHVIEINGCIEIYQPAHEVKKRRCDVRRRINVVTTSWSRIDVDTTLCDRKDVS